MNLVKKILLGTSLSLMLAGTSQIISVNNYFHNIPSNFAVSDSQIHSAITYSTVRNLGYLEVMGGAILSVAGLLYSKGEKKEKTSHHTHSSSDILKFSKV